MSRVVTYITEVPLPANQIAKMSSSMLLMMEMYRRGFTLPACRHDANTSVDYCLDAPDCIPAGACIQYETYTEKDEETCLDEYCISAHQITVTREDCAAAFRGRGK